MPSLPENLYSVAQLVAAVRALQPPLPAAVMGVAAPNERMGTSSSRRVRCVAVPGPIYRPTVGRTLMACGDLAGGKALAGHRLELLDCTYHPCLGLECHPTYSAVGDGQSVNRQVLDELKHQIPLLEYLNAHDWRPVRRLSQGRWMGLCPLHADHKPSFVIDSIKNLFYCYGCGRGGDVIRFAELYHQVGFSQALQLLRTWRGSVPLLQEVESFYRMQLHRHGEAVAYLQQRGLRSPELIEHMRVGYAPGRCLRAWLVQLGYPLSVLHQAGLVNAGGCDTFSHRVVFPLEGNLYGRSIGDAAPHRFLPGDKGGLYRWPLVQHCDQIVLVEGLFDFAALWQAGFLNVTCSLGCHLNARQLWQLCGYRGTVYLAFDSDANQSGQCAAQRISARLGAQGVTVRRVQLPEGHDPNSFFTQAGGDTRQFQDLLEQARP